MSSDDLSMIAADDVIDARFLPTPGTYNLLFIFSSDAFQRWWCHLIWSIEGSSRCGYVRVPLCDFSSEYERRRGEEEEEKTVRMKIFSLASRIYFSLDKKEREVPVRERDREWAQGERTRKVFSSAATTTTRSSHTVCEMRMKYCYNESNQWRQKIKVLNRSIAVSFPDAEYMCVSPRTCPFARVNFQLHLSRTLIRGERCFD